MNKDILLNVLGNIVTKNLIFENVHSFLIKDVRKSYKYIKIDVYKAEKEIYKWKDLIRQPQLLAYYNYFEEFKQYYQNNPFYTPRDREQCINVLVNVIRYNRLEMLKFLLENVKIHNKYLELISPYLFADSVDLLYIAVHFNQLEIAQYLTSSTMLAERVKWKYRHAMEAAGKLDGLDFLKFMVSKLEHPLGIDDIRALLVYASDRADIIEYILDIAEGIDEIKLESNTGMWERLVRYSISYGNLNLIVAIHKRGYFIDSLVYSLLVGDALHFHEIDIAMWLQNNSIGFSTSEDNDKIIAGNCTVEMVKWLAENRVEGFTSNAMNIAAEYGHLDILKWLHTNRTEGCTNVAIHMAIANNHIEVAKWLLENRPSETVFYTLDQCCITEKISLEMIKWIHQKFRGRMNDSKNYLLTQNPNAVEIARYLCEEQGYGDGNWTVDLMNDAAAEGALELIKYLHYNRTEGCTTEAMNLAARSGYFDVVVFLHENRTEGCTVEAIEGAVQHSHFRIARWLFENRTEGCTIDTTLMDTASSDSEFFKWLHYNRTELRCSKLAMNFAIDCGDLDQVKWLHENRTEGCSGERLDVAVKYGDLEMLQWFLENRTERPTADAPLVAVAHRQLEVFKWLHFNGYNCTSEKLIESAYLNGGTEIYEWILENMGNNYIFF